jgi:hypothetical protein
MSDVRVGGMVCAVAAHLLQRILAAPLEFQVPFQVEILPLNQLLLPRYEHPLHEVSVGRVSGCDEEVSVAHNQACCSREECDGFHDVPRELPEGQPEEETDLGDQKAQTRPEDSPDLLVCELVYVFHLSLELLELFLPWIILRRECKGHGFPYKIHNLNGNSRRTSI